MQPRHESAQSEHNMLDCFSFTLDRVLEPGHEFKINDLYIVFVEKGEPVIVVSFKMTVMLRAYFVVVEFTFLLLKVKLELMVKLSLTQCVVGILSGLERNTRVTPHIILSNTPSFFSQSFV